jgi:hypothetical protein
MKKLDLAWLAGVIDSDGCITIDKNTWRVRTLGQCPTYQEMIALSQITPEGVHLAQKLFGGSVGIQKPRGISRHPMYRWQARNKIAIVAIRSLFPFLRIKRGQAEILLRLRRVKERGSQANTKPSGIPRGRTLLPEVQAEMESFWLNIREANRPSPRLALGE